MTYREWVKLFVDLVASLLDIHPATRPHVEAHARSWGWKG